MVVDGVVDWTGVSRGMGIGKREEDGRLLTRRIFESPVDAQSGTGTVCT